MTDSPAPLPATPRSFVLDGVRGLAIVLVVLSHSWKIWPEDARDGIGSFAALFNSGSVAVSIFFTISGFLATRALLRARDSQGPTSALAWFTRRTIRITVQMWVLLGAVWLMIRFDPTDLATDQVNRESLLSAATYTWNTYVRDHALEARSDIGALYFLGIDVQVLAVMTLLVVAVGKYRRVLGGVVLTALVLSSVWRSVDFAAHGWFHATLTTVDRLDAILWGVAAALIAPKLTWSRERAAAYLGAGTLILLGGILSTAFFGLDAYFTWLGPIIGAATAMMVLADDGAQGVPTMAGTLWSSDRLSMLGRMSLTIFLWHIPIFEAMARHTPQWHPLPRSLVTIGVLIAVVALVERFVARPVDRLVGSWGRRPSARETMATTSDKSP